MVKIHKRYVISGVVALSLLGILGCSFGIVKRSGSSKEVLMEKSNYEYSKESETLESAKPVKEFVDDTTEYSKVSVLFSTDDVYERQQEYLGSQYDLYSDVLSEIEYSYESEFSSLPEVSSSDTSSWVSDYYDMNKGCTDIYSDTFLSGSKPAYFYNGLSIIGLYGTHCVVYKDAISELMGYNALIVADYSSSEFSTGVSEPFDFGQSKSLVIYPKYCTHVEYNGFDILYVKMV